LKTKLLRAECICLLDSSLKVKWILLSQILVRF